MGGDWGQEERSLNNILNYGLACCPLTLLVKDHKIWTVVPPVRPVMGGNVGGNAGMSEFISLALEPVADEMKDSMEINSTNGLIKDIEDVNDALDKEMEDRMNNQNSSKIQHNDNDRINKTIHNTLDEECIEDNSDVESNLQEDQQEEYSEVESSQQEDEACLSKQSSLQEGNSKQANIGHTLPPLSTMKKNDIRLYMTANKAGVKTIHVEEKQHGLQDDTKIDKMKMIREKMTQSRKRNEAQEIRNAILVRRRRVEKPTQWNGEDLVYAEDVGNEMVQDEVDLVVVVVGASTPPSLTWRSHRFAMKQ